MPTPNAKAARAQAHFQRKVLNRAQEAERLKAQNSPVSRSPRLNPGSSRPTLTIRPSTSRIYLNASVRDIKLVLCDPRTRDAALVWNYRRSHQNPMSAVPIEGTFTYQYMHTASYFKVPLDVNPVHLAEAIGVPPGQVIFRDFYKSPYGNLIRTAACGPSADLRESAKRDLENLVDGITASR